MRLNRAGACKGLPVCHRGRFWLVAGSTREIKNAYLDKEPTRVARVGSASAGKQAPAPIEFRDNDVAAEKVSPQGPAGASAARFNSPAGPLDLRGGVSSGGQRGNQHSRMRTHTASGRAAASPSFATGKTQPLDRIRPLSLLLETLGWFAVLGLAFWMVAMIAYAVGGVK